MTEVTSRLLYNGNQLPTTGKNDAGVAPVVAGRQTLFLQTVPTDAIPTIHSQDDPVHL